MSQPDTPLKYNRSAIIRGPYEQHYSRSSRWTIVLLVVLILALLAVIAFLALRDRYRHGAPANSEIRNPKFEILVAQTVEINGVLQPLNRSTSQRPIRPTPTVTPWLLASK